MKIILISTRTQEAVDAFGPLINTLNSELGTLMKIVFCLSLFLMPGLNGQENKINFHQEIEPLLAKYCYQCHGPKKQKSGVRIDTMNPDMLKGQHGGKWREILDAIDLSFP